MFQPDINKCLINRELGYSVVKTFKGLAAILRTKLCTKEPKELAERAIRTFIL